MSYHKTPRSRVTGRKPCGQRNAFFKGKTVFSQKDVPILIADYEGKSVYVSSIAELLDKYAGHATPGNLNNEIDSGDFVKALRMMKRFPRTVEQQTLIDNLREEIRRSDADDERGYRGSRR